MTKSNLLRNLVTIKTVIFRDLAVLRLNRQPVVEQQEELKCRQLEEGLVEVDMSIKNLCRQMLDEDEESIYEILKIVSYCTESGAAKTVKKLEDEKLFLQWQRFFYFRYRKVKPKAGKEEAIEELIAAEDERATDARQASQQLANNKEDGVELVTAALRLTKEEWPKLERRRCQEAESRKRCAVCLGRKSAGEHLVVLSCGHTFHVQCGLAALMEDPRCRQCRRFFHY